MSDNEVKEELKIMRQEMLDEQREEEREEIRLRSDYDYILEKSGMNAAIQKLQEASEFMQKYGWEVSTSSLV